MTSLLVLPCLVAAVVAGCGDDDTTSPPVTGTDSGVDSGSKDAQVADNFVPNDTGAPQDGGLDAADANDGAALAALQKRGQYLVEAVVGCSDCHTPRGAGGAPDMTKFLGGVDCFIPTSGPDAGCLNSANLTNDPTGLANRSDAEIKEMFMNGKRPNGKFLVNVMPYYTLHNLKAEDADAIVAYLRTVPAVSHAVAANQAPWDNVPAASAPVDPSVIPNAGDAGLEAGADLENGKYLAQFACMECHTKHTAPGSGPQAIDTSKLFAGNEAFPSAAIGLDPATFGENVYSANITPDDTGLKGWTVNEIKTVMQQGKDRGNKGVCPPMPTGPNGALGKLTEKDAVDIASYVHGVPAIANTIDGGSGSCALP